MHLFCNNTNAAPASPQPYGIVCWCADRVIAFLAFLLAFNVGLIVGALFPALILVLPVLIASAVILAVLIIAALIVKRCKCCRKTCGQ